MGSDSKHPDRRRLPGEYVAYVAPEGGSWVVRGPNPDSPKIVYETRSDAVAAASGALGTTGGRLFIANNSGRQQKHYVIGTSTFSAISAIEGIHLTPEMQADFREFDRLGLSPDERRGAIMRKYGKPG